MHKLSFILLAICISGCGGSYTNYVGPQGPKGDPGTPAPSPTSTTTAEDQDIANLVSDENDYRLGLGQTMLSSGLSCVLYTITGGDRIQASISGHNTLTGLSTVATFLYSYAFNQPNASSSDGLNVLPLALQPLYTNMFMLLCYGQIVVTDTDYHTFQLSSDDASLLYVDGSLVIDNDNAHGVTTISGMRYLRRGVHSFSLYFAQTGAGSQALILNTDGALAPANRFYH